MCCSMVVSENFRGLKILHRALVKLIWSESGYLDSLFGQFVESPICCKAMARSEAVIVVLRRPSMCVQTMRMGKVMEPEGMANQVNMMV